MNPDHPMAGVILTGGQSRRMGRVTKATVPLAGKPLLQHVIDRVAPQVHTLVLSVERYSPELAGFGLEQVADPRPGHAGPLGGLLSSLVLTARQNDWLLLVPCDAPFLPLDLGQRLQQTALDSGRAACVICYDGEVQPTFSVWHRSLLPSLEQAVSDCGLAGFKQYLDSAPQATMVWDIPEPKFLQPSPFFNINDPVALEEAERWLS